MVKVKNNKKSNIQNQIVKVILGGELSKKNKDKKDKEKKGKRIKGKKKELDNFVKPPFNRPQSNFLPPPPVLPGPPSVPGRFNTFPAPPSVSVRSDAPLSSVGSATRSAVSSAVPMDIATVLSSLTGSSNRSAVSSASPMDIQSAVESAVSRALSRSKSLKAPETDTETGATYDSFTNDYDFSGLPPGMPAPSDVFPDDSASQIFGTPPRRGRPPKPKPEGETPPKKRGRPPKQQVISEETAEDVVEQKPPSAPPKELSQADGQLSSAPLTNGGEAERGGGHTAESTIDTLYQAPDASGLKRPAPSTVSTAIVQDSKMWRTGALPVVARDQLDPQLRQYYDDIFDTFSGPELRRLIGIVFSDVQWEGGNPSLANAVSSIIAVPSLLQEFDSALEQGKYV
jgi:hypothetical protein